MLFDLVVTSNQQKIPVEKIQIQKSINQLIHSASIQTNDQFLNTQQQIEIQNNDTFFFTGFVDIINHNLSTRKKTLNLRSKSADIIDSRTSSNNKQIPLKKLITTLFAKHNQKTNYLSSINPQINGEFQCQSPFEIINQAIKQNNLRIFEDGNGNIQIEDDLKKIYKKTQLNTKTDLTNIVKTESTNQLFNKILIYSNSIKEEDLGNQVAEQTIETIRQSRILSIISQREKTKKDCENRLKEEISKRTKASEQLQATARGWTLPNGDSWVIGTIYTIDDQQMQLQATVFTLDDKTFSTQLSFSKNV